MFDIKKQLRWSKLKAGLVITIAFFALLVAVFFAGNIEKMFSPKTELKVAFRDVRGLRRGAPVWIFGTEVGSVRNIHLDPVHGAIVTVSINESALTFLKKDSQANIMTMGLLGDKYIELSAGSPQAEPLQPGELIKGTEPIQFSQIMETTSVAIGKMGEFIDKLDIIVTKMEKGEGTVAKFFTDPAIYNNLKKSTGTLSLLLEDIKNSEGTLKMLIEDPSLYKKTVTTISSIEEFTRKLNESSGTLKKLIEDPELYGNLNQAASRLSSILEGIEKGKGTAGALISDEELAKELRDLLLELRKLSSELDGLAKDIKEHPKKYFKFSVF
jgi:phospholipid/cholesterol/gamma-HCH transport system substrate-binding protein